MSSDELYKSARYLTSHRKHVISSLQTPPG